jgi:hypothetical protein
VVAGWVTGTLWAVVAPPPQPDVETRVRARMAAAVSGAGRDVEHAGVARSLAARLDFRSKGANTSWKDTNASSKDTNAMNDSSVGFWNAGRWSGRWRRFDVCGSVWAEAEPVVAILIWAGTEVPAVTFMVCGAEQLAALG